MTNTITNHSSAALRGWIATLLMSAGVSHAAVLTNLSSAPGEISLEPTGSQLAALVFTTGSASNWNLTDLTLLFYNRNGSGAGNVDISLYSVDSGTGNPDSVLATDTKSYAATNGMFTGDEISFTDLNNLSAVTLSASSIYALVVSSFTVETYPTAGWGAYDGYGAYSEVGSDDGFSVVKTIVSDGSTWSYTWAGADAKALASMAFAPASVSAVPEPASMLGMAALLGGGFLLRRRQPRG